MRKYILLLLAFYLGACGISFGQQSLGQNFIPDYTFKGSALTNWSTVGTAKWSAQNNEIIASATADGGFLQMNQSFQDVAVQLLIKCAAENEAGVLLRLRKNAEGTKAALISLKD